MMQLLVMCSLNAMAQKGDSAVNTPQQPAPTAQVVDTTLVKGLESMEDDDAISQPQTGFHNALKTKFIEGNAGFMSLVALALVLGLAFCIERIIFLTLSEINAKKFMEELSENISSKNLDKALQQCDATRGPVAAICKEGIMRINQPIEEIERSIVSYPRNCYRNGACFRPNTNRRRYKSNHCCIWNEGSSYHNHLRNHCGFDPTIIL